MNEHNRRDSDTFTKKISMVLPLVIALVSVIAMATTIKNKVDDHESRISRLESSLDRIALNTDKLVEILEEQNRRRNQ